MDLEQIYKSLFDTIDEGMAVQEIVRGDNNEVVDVIYRHVNRYFEDQVGARDAVGRSIFDILPGVEQHWLQLYERVSSTGEAQRAVNFQQDVCRWFEVYFSRVDEGGRFIATVFKDITDRKRADATLRESEERQAFLLKLSDVLQQLAQPNDIKAAGMQMLGQHLSVSRAQYHEVDSSGEYYGADGIGFADGLPLLDLKYRIGQFGTFVAENFEAGRPFRSDDLSVDPRPTDQEREAYGLYRIRAGAGIPLLRGGKLVAILAVHDTRPHAWTDLEMELIRETAERIWVAVEKVRVEIVTRESVARQTFLLSLSDALRAEPSADTVADRAIRMLAGQLQLDRCYIADYRLEDDRADITHQMGSDRLPPMPKMIRLSDFPEAFRAVFDQTLVIHDVLADQSLSPVDRENILSLGIRALMAPSLRKGAHRPLWVIVAGSAQPRHWTQSEIALGEDVAERIWVAVERARAEAALHKSEERFRQFAHASAAGLWIREAETLAMEFVSRAVGTIYGVEPDALLGDVKRWAAIVIPEDREVALRQQDKARRGEVAVYEFRIQRPSDGAFRWIRNTEFPLRDDGHLLRIGGIAEDITETRQLTEHQGVLLAELQHRVRNIMGMIRSMANRSAPGASTVDEYRTLLEGRLLALARVQALLTREANAGGSLRSVIESEVTAQAHHRGQFTLTGSDIPLAPKAVEVLTLAFHELATNALKYGALSVPDGRLSVTWTPIEKRGRPWLSLDWVEEGVPLREPSTRRGFGRELIEARIPYELSGRGTITIAPEGARCHLEFPLKSGESILETDAPQPATIFGGTLDMTGAPDLTGHTVLVVEDDYFLAADTAAALRGAGAKVLGPCPSEEATRDLLEDETPTHAVLDLNLGGGGPQFEIARMLKERGVPFVFLTGYDPDVIPEDMRNVVRLEKPLPYRAIVEAIGQL